MPPPARAIFFLCILFAPQQPEGVFFYLRLTGFETSWLYYVEELPSLIILTLFTQQVLAWARSYHVAVGEEGRYSSCVLRCAIAGNAAVVAAQVSLWGAYFGSRASGVDPDVFSVASASVHALSFLLCGAAMCAYGLANSAVVRTMSLGLELRLRQLRELALLFGACTAAFVLRALALAMASWANLYNVNNVRYSVTPGDAAASIAIFLCTELLPLWMILHHHRPRGRLKGSSSGAPAPVELGSPFASTTPLSPASLRAVRFSFSPTKGGTPRAGTPKARTPRGGAPPAQAPAPAPAAEPLGTGRALWMLGGMVWAALGLGGSSSSSSSSAGPTERQRLLGSEGGRVRMGLSAGAAAGGGAAVVAVVAETAGPRVGGREAEEEEEEEEEGAVDGVVLIPLSPKPLQPVVHEQHVALEK